MLQNDPPVPQAGVRSRSGVNLLAFGTFVAAIVIYSEVFDFCRPGGIALAVNPGHAVGAVGCGVRKVAANEVLRKGRPSTNGEGSLPLAALS